MSMTWNDVAMEMAYEARHNEAVMEEATLNQCIYLFVEGLSEARAFPILLEKAGVNLKELGILLANYNGSGNLVHSLRLLKLTLSHARPVVATVDNDENGAKIILECRSHFQEEDLIHLFPIPSRRKVRYPNGHVGGSFEELFSAERFLACCFREEVMEQSLVARKREFARAFDKNKPWYLQVKAFCAQYGDNSGPRKAKLAELLARECHTVPSSIMKLATLLKEVRKTHPVKDPRDVDVPGFG